MIQRKQQLKTWLNDLGYDDSTLTTASADASFRRYFRVMKGQQSYIVMDAPPEHESCDAFIALAQMMRQQQVNVPDIIEQDLQQGFLVLTDFGDQSLLSVLSDSTVDALYGKALSALLSMQNTLGTQSLPVYTAELLNTEMDLFKEWFLAQLLSLELTEAHNKLWDEAKQLLIASACRQPRVFVHRDYHSRNLMLEANGNLGIIDFQDAVAGPITYDLVSLLRDCYIAWPQQQVRQWVSNYYEQLKKQQLYTGDEAQFISDFDLMGVQRHLKAIGIFSRLKLRDGKAQYIHDIPRTFNYVQQVTEQYSGLQPLQQLIAELNLTERVQAL